MEMKTEGEVNASESEGEYEKISPELAAAFQVPLDKYLAEKGKPRQIVDFSSCKACADAAFLVKERLGRQAKANELNERFLAVYLTMKRAAELASTPSSELLSSLAAYRSSRRTSVMRTRCTTTISKRAGNTTSSGFGKSRLLRELAVHFTTSDVVEKGLHRLMYVNMRGVERSMEYPPKTEGLASCLFPPPRHADDDTLVADLTMKLRRVYDFVMRPEPPGSNKPVVSARWKGMHEELLALFSVDDANFVASFCPARLHRRRSKHLALAGISGGSWCSPLTKRAWCYQRWTPNPSAGFAFWDGQLKKPTRIRLTEPKCGIFAIVVDTKVLPSVFVPPPEGDSSQREPLKEFELFPPFVLTHTIDVHHTTTMNEEGELVPDPTARSKLDRAKDEVIAAVQALPTRESWRKLRRLGRPLWLKCKPGIHRWKDDLTWFAANKILGGRKHSDPKSYDEASLNGVASMLCRVGIRPHSSSPLMAAIVADFMGVLSYSSDPILTLGALRVWYGWKSSLSAKILSQLQRLLAQEVLDTG